MNASVQGPRRPTVLEDSIPEPLENPQEAHRYQSYSLEQIRSQSESEGRGDRATGEDDDAGVLGKRMTHDSLERQQSGRSRRSRRESQGGNADLTELAVPPPIDKPADGSSSPEDLDGRSPKEAPGKSLSEVATKLYTVSYLIFFSIMGTLARVGLQALTTYPGAPVTTGVLWANFGGTMVMGFLAEDRRLFQEEWGPPPPTTTTTTRKAKDEESATANGVPLEKVSSSVRRKQHGAVKKTIPLFIGLATGFCGSFTSFSSFQRDVFLALSNSAPTTSSSSVAPRNGGYSFLALLATLLLTPCMCLAALRLGAHIALSLDRTIRPLPFIIVRNVLDPLVVAVALLSWLGALLLAILPPDRPGGGPSGRPSWADESWRGDVVFAILFAPLGCLARYYVSLWLNGRIAAFPLGTFTVNILGTLMESVFYDLQHAPLPAAGTLVGGGLVGCQVLQGAMDGFCGCLTTVSTWVAELNGLRRRHGYIYGGMSLGAGLGVVIVVMGSLKWTHGFAETACGK